MLEAALLIIIGCMFGLIILYRQLHHENIYTTVRVSELKVLISSLRHDLSLDRQGMDERFDTVDRHLERLGHKIGQDGTKTRLELAEAVDAQYEQHKKTRKDIQEVKTGNEWAKKREHEIIEKLDDLLDRQSGASISVELPFQVGENTVVLKEGETKVINGTKVTRAAGSASVNSDVKNKRKKSKPAKKV